MLHKRLDGQQSLLLLVAYGWLTCRVSAFPLYFSANGSVLLTSASGGNVTLRPDGGGAIVATSVIAAQGGVALNNTLLTEQLLALQDAAISQLASEVVELRAEISAMQATLQAATPLSTCSRFGTTSVVYNGSAWVCICAQTPNSVFSLEGERCDMVTLVQPQTMVYSVPGVYNRCRHGCLEPSSWMY